MARGHQNDLCIVLRGQPNSYWHTRFFVCLFVMKHCHSTLQPISFKKVENEFLSDWLCNNP